MQPRDAGLRRGTRREEASIYEVDGGGRLLSETHGLTGLEAVTVAPGASPAAGNAVVAAAVGKGAAWTRYRLDGRHNWAAVTGPDGMWRPSADAGDRYRNLAGTAPDYDAAGSLLDDGTLAARYDAFGAVTRVDTGGAARDYVRDALGRVVAERDVATGDITRYAYDGARRVVRQAADGTVDVMVGGQGLDEHLVRLGGDGRRWFVHQQRHGSVYLVTDQAGAPAEWYTYTAYGDMTIESPAGDPLAASAIGNPFGYQGRPYDPVTGLVDMRARLYQPRWGRFLSADPLGYGGGTNLFAFVDAAPLLWRDPFGLRPQGQGVIDHIDNLAYDVYFDGLNYEVHWRDPDSGDKRTLSLPPSHAGFGRDTDVADGDFLPGTRVWSPKVYARNTTPRINQAALSARNRYGAASTLGMRGFARVFDKLAWAMGGGIAGDIVLAIDGYRALRAALRFGRRGFQALSRFFGTAERSAARGAWAPGRTATGKVPSSWGSGSATKKGVGVRWTDPANKGNGIRIDAGNPANSQVTQQVDHVIVRHNGQVIGRSGQPIRGSIADNAAEAHIPLSEWQTWSNWFSP